MDLVHWGTWSMLDSDSFFDLKVIAVCVPLAVFAVVKLGVVTLFQLPRLKEVPGAHAHPPLRLLKDDRMHSVGWREKGMALQKIKFLDGDNRTPFALVGISVTVNCVIVLDPFTRARVATCDPPGVLSPPYQAVATRGPLIVAMRAAKYGDRARGSRVDVFSDANDYGAWRYRETRTVNCLLEEILDAELSSDGAFLAVCGNIGRDGAYVQRLSLREGVPCGPAHRILDHRAWAATSNGRGGWFVYLGPRGPRGLLPHSRVMEVHSDGRDLGTIAFSKGSPEIGMAQWPGIGLLLLRRRGAKTQVEVLLTGDAMKMTFMSRARVGWMGAVARGIARRHGSPLSA